VSRFSLHAGFCASVHLDHWLARILLMMLYDHLDIFADKAFALSLSEPA